MGIKRNGYYRYQKQTESRTPDYHHKELLGWIKEIARASENSYGSRRMRKALNALGYPVGRTQARKLMIEAGVQVRYRKKYKVTTNSDHRLPVFDNVLERQFTRAQADQAYVSDITYIWTQEGWLYLCVFIDLYSRKVIGWSMGSRMKAELVCDALKMAIWQRRPEPGLIVHSDRGSQYASKQYRNLLNANGFIGSMSRKGNCWDNSVAESFFGSLKQERVHWRHYQTRYEAQQDILQYITVFYNQNRLHSFLDYKSPNQFELEMKNMKKAA
jgi:putative transposase